MDRSALSGIDTALADRVAQAERQNRLVAALAYLFTPLIPVIVLATDMRRDAFLRLHATRALVSAIILVVGLGLFIVMMIALLRQNFLWICLFPVAIVLPFVPGAIWARRVYLYGDVRPPVITQIAERLFPAPPDASDQ